MNAKTAIVVSLCVLGILRAGLAIIFDLPPLVWTITIVIPSWLIAAGGMLLLLLIVLWLRVVVPYHMAGPLGQAAEWLQDDSAPTLPELLDRRPYTGPTTRIDSFNSGKRGR